MTRLNWNVVGERYFETGVDRGVLYVGDAPGVPWNGLVSVDESPDGGEVARYYYDGYNYLNRETSEEFKGSIEAYYSPSEFDVCEGYAAAANGLSFTRQRKKSFGITYRTMVGNDVAGSNYGYKIHIIYNCLLSPVSKNHKSNSNSVDVSTLTWDFVAKPIAADRFAPTPHVIVDSTLANHVQLSQLEDILYGTDTDAPRLPTPNELITLLGVDTALYIVDNGDGSFSISGPGDQVTMLDADHYKLTSRSITMLDADTYSIVYRD